MKRPLHRPNPADADRPQRHGPSLSRRGLLVVALLGACSTAAAQFDLPFTRSPMPRKGTFMEQAHPPAQPVSALPAAYILPLRAVGDGTIFPPGASQAYLQSLVDVLQNQWSHPSPPVTVHLASSFFPPSEYHAVASADDTIVVHVGLLEQAEVEDELAFVLAHELAHVLLGHMGHKDFLEETRRSSEVALQLARLGGTISAIDFDAVRDSGEINIDEVEVRERQGKALDLYDGYHDVMEDVFMPHWSRRHEDEADLLAIDLIAAAGYSPDYAELVFLKLEQAMLARENHFTRLFNSYQDYLKNMTGEQISKTLTPINNGQSTPADFFKELRQTVERGLVDAARLSVLDRLRPDHPDPKKRAKTLRRYIDREYADTLDREPRAQRLEALQASAEFATLLDVRQAVMDTRSQLQAGRVEQGLASIKPASSGRFKHYGEGRWLKYQLREAQGERADAIANLDLAARGTHPGVRTYAKLFAHRWEAGDQAGAYAAVEAAEVKFGDYQHYLPERIFAAARNGQSIDGIYLQCMDSAAAYLHPICAVAPIAQRPDFRDLYAELYCALQSQQRQTAASNPADTAPQATGLPLVPPFVLQNLRSSFSGSLARMRDGC